MAIILAEANSKLGILAGAGGVRVSSTSLHRSKSVVEIRQQGWDLAKES